MNTDRGVLKNFAKFKGKQLCLNSMLVFRKILRTYQRRILDVRAVLDPPPHTN